jgi:hypothetical protein
MDQMLAELLERAYGASMSADDVEERRIAMAVANGALSDSRITVDAMRAVRTVDLAHKSLD